MARRCVEALSSNPPPSRRPLLQDEQAAHRSAAADWARQGAAEPCGPPDLGPPDLSAEAAEAPLAPATAALAAARVRGATLAAEQGDLTLPWLGRLAALVAVGYTAEPALDAPPLTPLDFTLHLQVGVGRMFA